MSAQADFWAVLTTFFSENWSQSGQSEDIDGHFCTFILRTFAPHPLKMQKIRGSVKTKPLTFIKYNLLDRAHPTSLPRKYDPVGATPNHKAASRTLLHSKLSAVFTYCHPITGRLFGNLYAAHASFHILYRGYFFFSSTPRIVCGDVPSFLAHCSILPNSIGLPGAYRSSLTGILISFLHFGQPSELSHTTFGTRLSSTAICPALSQRPPQSGSTSHWSHKGE